MRLGIENNENIVDIQNEQDRLQQEEEEEELIAPEQQSFLRTTLTTDATVNTVSEADDLNRLIKMNEFEQKLLSCKLESLNLKQLNFQKYIDANIESINRLKVIQKQLITRCDNLIIEFEETKDPEIMLAIEMKTKSLNNLQTDIENIDLRIMELESQIKEYSSEIVKLTIEKENIQYLSEHLRKEIQYLESIAQQNNMQNNNNSASINNNHNDHHLNNTNITNSNERKKEERKVYVESLSVLILIFVK